MQNSRYHINQLVKAVLVKNNVDLTQLHYTSTEKSVYLFGSFAFLDMSKSEADRIKTVLNFLTSIPQVKNVQVETDNWIAVPGEEGWHIYQRKQPGGSGANRDNVLNLSRKDGEKGAEEDQD